MKESVTSGGMAAFGGFGLFLYVGLVLMDLKNGLKQGDMCKGRGLLQALKSILSEQTVSKYRGQICIVLFISRN